jgi:hypothetical protein
MVNRPREISKVTPQTEETHKSQFFTELVKIMAVLVSYKNAAG